jgi:hypothetical protein
MKRKTSGDHNLDDPGLNPKPLSGSAGRSWIIGRMAMSRLRNGIRFVRVLRKRRQMQQNPCKLHKVDRLTGRSTFPLCKS